MEGCERVPLCLERSLKRNSSWVATGNHNVFIALDFNFVDKPAEEKVEEKKEPVEQIQE